MAEGQPPPKAELDVDGPHRAMEEALMAEGQPPPTSELDVDGPRPVTQARFRPGPTVYEQVADKGMTTQAAVLLASAVGIVDNPLEANIKKARWEEVWRVHAAANEGDLDTLQSLTQSTENVDITNRALQHINCTPLHAAVLGGQTNCIIYLLSKNADPNKYTTYDTQPSLNGTALHVLARCNWTRKEPRRAQRILGLLIDAGANIHALARDNKRIPMDSALEASNPSMVEALLAGGSEPAKSFCWAGLAQGTVACSAEFAHCFGVMPLLSSLAYNVAMEDTFAAQPSLRASTEADTGKATALMRLVVVANDLPAPHREHALAALGLSLWKARHAEGPYAALFEEIVKVSPPNETTLPDWLQWAVEGCAADQADIEDRRIRYAMLRRLIELAEPIARDATSTELDGLLGRAREVLTQTPTTIDIRVMPQAGTSFLYALPYVCNCKSFVEVSVDVDEPVWKLKETLRAAHPAFEGHDISLHANGFVLEPALARLTAFDLRHGQTMAAVSLDDPPPPPFPPQRDGEIFVCVKTPDVFVSRGKWEVGPSAYISIRRDATAAMVMALASQRLPETVSMKRLLFAGQALEPDDTLASKGVTELSCLEVA